jgi:hypothetical protein
LTASDDRAAQFLWNNKEPISVEAALVPETREARYKLAVSFILTRTTEEISSDK